MRLLRRRPKPQPGRPETPGQRDADKALTRARNARREAESRRPAVAEITSRLARQRESNHFAEMFRAALEGDR